VVMTLGVYGLVAAIVKLDDAGLYLSRRPGAASRGLGALLLVAAPWLMRTLAVLGTAAMFLVGGSILAHGLPVLHETAALASQAPLLGWALDGAVGLLAGALLVAVMKMAGAWRRRLSDKR
jgi:uncharacterized protein